MVVEVTYIYPGSRTEILDLPLGFEGFTGLIMMDVIQMEKRKDPRGW
jgi:hypothetical protein